MVCDPSYLTSYHGKLGCAGDGGCVEGMSCFDEAGTECSGRNGRSCSGLYCYCNASPPSTPSPQLATEQSRVSWQALREARAARATTTAPWPRPA